MGRRSHRQIERRGGNRQGRQPGRKTENGQTGRQKNRLSDRQMSRYARLWTGNVGSQERRHKTDGQTDRRQQSDRQSDRKAKVGIERVGKLEGRHIDKQEDIQSNRQTERQGLEQAV